jgi:hypothetical protein
MSGEAMANSIDFCCGQFMVLANPKSATMRNVMAAF